MALETLIQMGFGEFITINHETNEITFKIQNGPIKEVGENGCQLDQLIYIAKVIILGLNREFPCGENQMAVNALELALYMLDARKKDREKRGVEGKNEV